jgi:1-deoxy-D-xylulose-5-phosphate reductoisomerase
MRVPISFALTYPNRETTTAPTLDLAAGLTLDFGAPDLETFPLLALARAAGMRGGTAPCAFNAANEAAVGAFLEGRLGFLEIADAVADVLEMASWPVATDYDDLVSADTEARHRVAERVTVA